MRHLYSFTDFINEGKVEDIQSKYYAGMEPATFHQIVTADPTSITQNGETKKMGTYSKWLLKLFQDGKLLLEDLYKATEYLTLFNKLKAQKVITGAEADINRYGSLPDLFKQLKEIGGTGETGEDESYLLKDRYYINQGEAEVFHEDDDYLIVIPRTLKASQFYALGTEWCTQYPDMFKKYSGQGDLYIIIVKNQINTESERRRMQFHFQTTQFMDMVDDDIYAQEREFFVAYFQSVKESWKLRYDSVVDETTEGFYIVRQNRKFGLVDTDGNVVIPCRYDMLTNFTDGRAIVSNNGLCGTIDKDGNEVVACSYTRIAAYTEGRAIVSRGSDHGAIDLDGNLIIPCQYDWIDSFRDGKAVAYKNQKYGIIDPDGNEVIPLMFDHINPFFNGSAQARKNGEWCRIYLDGNISCN
jgi:hypothetical protein